MRGQPTPPYSHTLTKAHPYHYAPSNAPTLPYRAAVLCGCATCPTGFPHAPLPLVVPCHVAPRHWHTTPSVHGPGRACQVPSPPARTTPKASPSARRGVGPRSRGAWLEQVRHGLESGAVVGGVGPRSRGAWLEWVRDRLDGHAAHWPTPLPLAPPRHGTPAPWHATGARRGWRRLGGGRWGPLRAAAARGCHGAARAGWGPGYGRARAALPPLPPLAAWRLAGAVAAGGLAAGGTCSEMKLVNQPGLVRLLRVQPIPSLQRMHR